MKGGKKAISSLFLILLLLLAILWLIAQRIFFDFKKKVDVSKPLDTSKPITLDFLTNPHKK